MSGVGAPDWAERCVAALGAEAVRAEPALLRPRDREGLRRGVEILVEARASWAPVDAGRFEDRVGVEAPRGFFDFWPNDLVARIGGGTPMDSIERALAPLGLRLGAWAGGASRSLGAALATADRGGVGALGHTLRERVLGATVVDGGGELLHSGARVVKSVAGFDLTRVHHGAHGSLGVVGDLTVRLEAAPPARAGRFLAGGIEATLEALPRWREKTLRESLAELWICPATAMQLGLGDEGGLLAWREGDASTLEEWTKALGGEAVDLEPWSVVARRPAATSLRIPVSPSRFRDVFDPADGLRGAGFVGDLLAGEVRTHATRRLETREVEDFATGLAPWDARVWVEAWPVGARPRESWGSLARERSEERMRRLYDPLGLLPPPPRPVTVGAQEGGGGR